MSFILPAKHYLSDYPLELGFHSKKIFSVSKMHECRTLQPTNAASLPHFLSSHCNVDRTASSLPPKRIDPLPPPPSLPHFLSSHCNVDCTASSLPPERIDPLPPPITNKPHKHRPTPYPFLAAPSQLVFLAALSLLLAVLSLLIVASSPFLTTENLLY